MKSVVAKIKIPTQLDKYMHEIFAFFPNSVDYDKDTKTTTIQAELSFEVRVTLSYVSFVAELESVTDSLDIVLSDLSALSSHPPYSAKEGDARYFFLTRAFFHELLRIKDAFPRFLKRMELDGVMTREQRLSSKKLIEEVMHEHYLIRNTYLHGHTMPKNDHEHDLSLMASAFSIGYQPELVPLDGSDTKSYPAFLIGLANKRHDLLLDLANEYVRLFQSILDATATFLKNNRFESSAAET